MTQYQPPDSFFYPTLALYGFNADEGYWMASYVNSIDELQEHRDAGYWDYRTPPWFIGQSENLCFIFEVYREKDNEQTKS